MEENNEIKKGYCIKCGVRTEEDRAHCPVCGKCINEENIGKPRDFAYYPRYTKWKKDRRHVMTAVSIILIICNLLWFGFEFGFNNMFLDTYYYFLAGSITIFTVIIWPFIKRVKFLTKSVVGVSAIMWLLIFIDAYSVYRYNLSTGEARVFGWSICVAVPMLLMGYAIAVGLTMLFRGYYGRSALYPNLYIAALATIMFGLNLTVFNKYNVYWCSIVILAVSWAIVAALFITRYKKILSGIKKDFHI